MLMHLVSCLMVDYSPLTREQTTGGVVPLAMYLIYFLRCIKGRGMAGPILLAAILSLVLSTSQHEGQHHHLCWQTMTSFHRPNKRCYVSHRMQPLSNLT